ncbi:hypothetical protein GCM10010151_64640 [Actinoallomurus spadix]|uniref:Transposase n=1 Tax=Actinoallomurus spadix TaxID=79912 RepID=A0ABP3HBT3_9ACTN
MVLEHLASLALLVRYTAQRTLIGAYAQPPIRLRHFREALTKPRGLSQDGRQRIPGARAGRVLVVSEM